MIIIQFKGFSGRKRQADGGCVNSFQISNVKIPQDTLWYLETDNWVNQSIGDSLSHFRWFITLL